MIRLVMILMIFLTCGMQTVAAQGGDMIILRGNDNRDAKPKAKVETEDEVANRLKEQARQIRKRLLNGAPQFGLQGRLTVLSGRTFSINGEQFVTTDKTRIYGRMRNFAPAKVVGYIENGVKIAQVVNIGDGSKVVSPSNEGPVGEGAQLRLPSGG